MLSLRRADVADAHETRASICTGTTQTGYSGKAPETAANTGGGTTREHSGATGYSRTDGLVVVGERTNGPVIWRQTRKMQ